MGSTARQDPGGSSNETTTPRPTLADMRRFNRSTHPGYLAGRSRNDMNSVKSLARLFRDPESDLPTNLKPLRAAAQPTICVVITFAFAVLMRPAVGLLQGPVDGDYYYNLWTMATTTAVSFSTPIAGKGIVTAWITLAGGAIAVLIEWVLIDYNLSLLASLPFLVVSLFILQCGPELFQMNSQLCDTISLQLITVVVGGYSIPHDPARRDFLVQSLLIGVLVGVFVAFFVSSVLLPRTGTSAYLNVFHHCMGLMHTYFAEGMNPIMTADRNELRTKSKQASQGNQSAQGNSSSDARSLQHTFEEAVQGYLAEHAPCMEYLRAAQNESYIAMPWGGYCLLPTWPFNFNSLSLEDMTRVHFAMRQLGWSAIKLMSVSADALLPDVEIMECFLGDPEHGRVKRILELSLDNMAQLVNAFPARVEPGRSYNLSDTYILRLQEELDLLLESQQTVRDAILRNIKSPGSDMSSNILLSINREQANVWLAFLHSLAALVDSLTVLHVVVESALAYLPWNQDKRKKHAAKKGGVRPMGSAQLRRTTSRSVERIRKEANLAMALASQFTGGPTLQRMQDAASDTVQRLSRQLSSVVSPVPEEVRGVRVQPGERQAAEGQSGAETPHSCPGGGFGGLSKWQ